jgi:hypothetical protein
MNKVSICVIVFIVGIANSALNAANAPFKERTLAPSPHILKQLKGNGRSPQPGRPSLFEEFRQLAALRHPEKWQGKENDAQAVTVGQETSEPKVARTFYPKKISQEQTEEQRQRQQNEGYRVLGRYRIGNSTPLDTRRSEILGLQLGLPIFNRLERQID